MFGRCTLTGFKILTKPTNNLTTIQVEKNSLNRIVKEIKKEKLKPHNTAEAEELEFAPNPSYWS